MNSEILNKKICNLDVTCKTYICLYKSDIQTISDVLDNEDRIMNDEIRNLGNKGREEIKNLMRSFGFQDFGKCKDS